MNRKSGFRALPLFLFVVSCLAGVSSGRAQQTAAGNTGTYAPGTGATSSTGTLNSPGLYSSESTVLTGGSALGIASRMGMTASSATGENSTSANKGDGNSRSGWLAGSSSIGSERSAGWDAGVGAFSARTGASWNAGGNSFGLSRQQDSIWRVMPPSESAPSSTLAQSSGLSTPRSAHISSGLTAKGAALVSKAGLSSPFPSHQRTGSGFGSPGRPSFGARSGFGSSQSQFGSGIGSKSTQHTSSSESLTDPALHDSGPLLNQNLPGNGGLESPGNLRLGPDEIVPGDSH